MEFPRISLPKSYISGLIIFTTQCFIIKAELEVHYCDSSNKSQYLETEKECPNSGARSLPRHYIGMGQPKRAWLTIPPYVIVKNSSVPNGGLGVFSKTFIPAYTWLGEYEGQRFSPNNGRSDYAWACTCNKKLKQIINGEDISRSNWLRWVNCARNPLEENIKLRKCFKSIFYMTKRLILPGEELMIYYGDTYAKSLGIDTDRFTLDWGLVSGSKTETSPSPQEIKRRQQHINLQIIMKALHISEAEAIKALERNDNDMQKTMTDLLLGAIPHFDVNDLPDKFA